MDNDEAFTLTTFSQLEDGGSRILWNDNARRKIPEDYHLCKKIIPKVDFKEILTY